MSNAWEQIESFEPWVGGDYRPLAVLGLEPAELTARLGITFADTEVDGLGPCKWAGLKLATGEQILLTRQAYSPEVGTQLDTGLYPHRMLVLARFLQATGIEEAKVIWRSPLTSLD